ncbi:MAG: nucleotidyltransferase domain-containing protein [Gemmatimonadetes bacterium]|nr:nucleotidyltransferase domain-containing protein [Gemmatimonadota bacterium]
MHPAVLERIVRQIVEIAHPERIILFGSAARGEMGPHSDVDLLVVKAGDYLRRALAERIYIELDVDEAVDVVIATPEDLERYGDSFALVYYPALREGREVYRAA